MNAVSCYLRPYTVVEKTECPLCLDETPPEEKDPQDWVEHEDPAGSSGLHPVHRACLTRCFQAKHKNCPTCRTVFQNRQVRCLSHLMPQGLDLSKMESKEAKAMQDQLSKLSEEVLTKKGFSEADEKKIEEAVSKILHSFVSPLQVVKEALEVANSLKSKQKEGVSNPSSAFCKEVAMISSAQTAILESQKNLKLAESSLKKTQENGSFFSICCQKVNLAFVQMKAQSEMKSSLRLLNKVLMDAKRQMFREEMDRLIKGLRPPENLSQIKGALESAQSKLEFAEKILALQGKQGGQGLLEVGKKVFLALFVAAFFLLLFFLI